MITSKFRSLMPFWQKKGTVFWSMSIKKEEYKKGTITLFLLLSFFMNLAIYSSFFVVVCLVTQKNVTILIMGTR